MTSAKQRPRSLLDLYLSFSWLALQGFGGALAVIQQELVEKKRWLTREEFVEEWAAAQVLPGPNAVNLALMLGARHFGWRGALASVLGMVSIPVCILLALGFAFAHFAGHPGIVGALRGMGAVTAGLIIAAALRLTPALKNNPLGIRFCTALAIAAFVAVGLLHWSLIWVLIVLGPLAVFIVYRRSKS